MSDKAKGKMKEAYGALVGDEAKKEEGRAQERMEADMSEKAIGKAKEAYGALAGDEAKKAEGRAPAEEGRSGGEAEQRMSTSPTGRRRPSQAQDKGM
jgi:uncharacterized protein YjbJ (UPF0337 family)